MVAQKRKVPLLGRLMLGEGNLFKRILLIFVFAFILVLVIINLSLLSMTKLHVNTEEVIHTQQVISGFDELLSIMKDAETGQRGYVLTRDSAFLGAYITAGPELYQTNLRLRKLVTDNVSQVKRLALLDSLILKRRVLLDMNLKTEQLSIESFRQGNAVMNQIRDVVKDAKEEELDLMRQRKANLERSTKQTRTTITIFSLMALALVIVPLIFTLFELRKRLILQQLLDSVLNSSLNVIQSFESIRDVNNNIIDFRLIQANETSQKLLQKNVSTVIGMTLLEIFPEQQFDNFFEQFRQVVEKGISHDTEFEAALDGTIRWYHATAVKLRDGFTLTIQDITDSKKSAIDLKNNVVALQRSNAELEQFAYVASHDLQEPLRKILTFIDLLKLKSDIELNTEAGNYLQRISNAALRMRGLISDLLSYSRTGSIQSEIETVNLNVLMQEVLSDLEVFIQQKSAVITCHHLPAIEGMKVQLYQLFQNLINNSLKFAAEGRPPVITIDSEYVADASGIKPAEGGERKFCRITFTDNGIGFEEKYKDKIFQIFQRLHGKSKYDGTGIGLAICKKIIEIHNGTIVANGYPGKGAVFIVTLPLKQKKYRST